MEKDQNIFPDFNKEKVTLLLRFKVDPEVPLHVRETAKQKGFGEKPEHHITVMGDPEGIYISEKLNKMSVDEKKTILSKIEDLIKNTKWSYKLTPHFFYVTKEYSLDNIKNTNGTIGEVRESIIQLVGIKEIKDFYKKLNIILSDNIDAPETPHITVYTRSTEKAHNDFGFCVSSFSQLRNFHPERINLK